ncbi:MAG: hypothetical protein AAGI03_01220 [Pseudomonadota bacterium]
MSKRCLVVTSREVVALDLEEMMTALGASSVDTLRSVLSPPPDGYMVAFLDAGMLSGPGDPLISSLREWGTTVVVMLASSPAGFGEAGAIPLPMPFTSRDVERLMQQHGIAFG